MRGFPVEEFQARTARAQALMAKHDLCALLLTTEEHVRYFTGYLTRFWESPSRPWFLIVPAQGKPIAVIPSIGAALMGNTWIDDVRTWTSPNLVDDGIGLVVETLQQVAPNARVGVPDGHETHIRMPYADVVKLSDHVTLVSDCDIMRSLRMIKSENEISKIRRACEIGGRAMQRVPEIAQAGVTLEEVFRKFQILCLEEGADWVPYVAGAAEPNGYPDVISPAKSAPLQQGDVLMLDTGLVWDGYFCDFDRNWSVGPASAEVREAHARLVEASDAAFECARPGIRASDLFTVMRDIVGTGPSGTDPGRLGHGLGMSLTEWPSLIAADHTVLQEGMVLTLEPGVPVSSGLLVHEENIVITATGAEYLSPRKSAEVIEL